MAQTGKRVAEMHLALASRDDIADFRAGADQAGGRRSAGSIDVMARADRVFDALAQRRETLTEADRPLADAVAGAARTTLHGPPDGATAAATSTVSTSAIMATSISARC